jgi:SAM-dependent methyltransferase
MKKLMKITIITLITAGFIHSLNLLSYQVLKKRILRRRKWDLNLCCGSTDGGGINVDIVRRPHIPNHVVVDVYNLPFKGGSFNTVLCSHTIEHVEQPRRLFKELKRVGSRVTLVTPPIWDLSAAFNVLEHKWIFWSPYKEHYSLPRFTRLPLSAFVQDRIGQRIKG